MPKAIKQEEAAAARTALDDGFLPIERRFLRFSTGEDRGYLVLRLLLAAALYFQAAGLNRRWNAIAAALAVYASAAAALFWLRRRAKISSALHRASLMLDIAISLAVLYSTQGMGSETFIALLLLILGSCLLRKPAYIFSVSLGASLAYALLSPPANLYDFTHVLPLRLSLFLLIALFSVHLADYVGWIERQTASQYEERLAWVQRLSMVGRAMAAVLHEAKTPLGTIVLNTESAEAMVRAGKTPSEELRAIAEEADHATEILQNFLDFVRPNSLDMRILRIHEPLMQAVDMLTIRMDERGVELTLATLTDCVVQGSGRHLVQVFSNIIHNSIDAMPSGGKLRIWMKKEDPQVQIHFEDTGIGIDADRLDRLFEPFNSSKSGAEGHGLGLGIVRWILQEHGGDVRIESRGKNQGAHATVLLPLAKDHKLDL